ncbi:hypothetical protein Tco_0643236 [Tanacetum coccineum]
MKRVSKGYSRAITPLFDTMLVQHQGEEPSIQTTPETSPSKITSSPSLSSHHRSISAPSTSQPPITPSEEVALMPHESSLHSVHSLGRDEESSENKTRGRRKKSLTRKRAKETLSEESAKKQKLENDAKKEELQILANDKYYYEIKRADGSVKHYKIFSAMLYDFDRKDVLELYRLVKDRFQTASPEGYDLLLWEDLKTLIEPNEEDKIWRNQQDWNLIN